MQHLKLNWILLWTRKSSFHKMKILLFKYQNRSNLVLNVELLLVKKQKPRESVQSQSLNYILDCCKLYLLLCSTFHLMSCVSRINKGSQPAVDVRDVPVWSLRLTWDHCGLDRPQQLHTWAPLPPTHINTTTQKSIHYENRLEQHTNTYMSKWVHWKGVKSRRCTQSGYNFTSLFIKITEFKLLLIFYHYHLQYLNRIFFFSLLDNLKHPLRILSVCTVWGFTTINTGVDLSFIFLDF